MTKLVFATLACTTIIMFGVVYFIQPRTPAKNAYSTIQPPEKLNHTLKHLAIIMDGNRRWAKSLGKKPWEGHRGGIEPVKQTVEFCIDQNIPYLSLYTFSLENFNRPQTELDELFSTIERGLTNEEFTKLMDHGVKVRFIGDRSKFPASLLTTINGIENKTKNNKKLELNLLFCYGGQQELTDAVQRIAAKAKSGAIEPASITPELIQKHLWTEETPNPDLIIRTSGVQRLSNFLTWQSAYSELMFIDKYWPEVTQADLLNALKAFETIKRNFGV